MNDRNFDQLLNAWMDLGPTTAPDRVADAARLEAATTRQRPAILSRWAPRRFPTMNTPPRSRWRRPPWPRRRARLQLSRCPECRRARGSSRQTRRPTPSPSPSGQSTSRRHEGEGQRCSPGSYLLDTARRGESSSPCPTSRGSDTRPLVQGHVRLGSVAPEQQREARIRGRREPAGRRRAIAGPGWQDPAVGPGVADLVEGLGRHSDHRGDTVQHTLVGLLRGRFSR